ncbi:cell surface protein SprA [Segatella copri]|uniref:Cell surface protein SprA n=1 Tax=Segatella copri TaxID=165179 RepID=A0AAW5IW20_9BACT|nr:cell surface protein SprA [Segatella copri]MCP9553544.1 cell surface protein SprA [Segatella copri]MCP9574131.1 cell surface protein SprA [Segatella copri]MCP9577313.1 cell surface protein SprA [Segatella copri]MCP9580207.1 cell surface protein SprA [Segatella copri]MCP9583113.1 cell surface protein SprA [Segatella copri]
MKQKQRFISFLLAWLMVATFGYAIALPQLQDDKKKTHTSTVQSVQLDEDTIPDSLLHTRWQIQRTQPYSLSDLYQSPLDLKRPDNLQYQVVYNDTLDRYIIGNRMGSTWLSAPIMLTPKEYLAWTEQQQRNSYFRKQNDEIFQAKGKEKFDFSDMHFDLGPAEKIFGPGGIRVKTQGSAELKFGINKKNIDNPSLPIRNRKTTMMDFDEKINLNVNGKVGDKVNMNLNYNTDATFDFDAQNMKLKYDGKEDEIIKLVEAGNVSFPSNSSLIKGASSLFGVRTDMQFGKLKLQMVASQKKSASKSVSTRGGVQLTPFELNVADYEENRHFFLSQYFRNHYDAWMQKLPNLTTGITINRVEVWVTNKTGNTTNTRNIVALTDLGENQKLSNPMWAASGQVPSNQANTEYAAMNSQYAAARDIDQAATTLDGGGLVGGADYEKLESARLLNSSEYTVNIALGYISLKTSLQTDQVLAVAYEYTSGGVTYQVGEFASDLSDTKQALFVKSLKNTSNNPRQGNWGLMMKNVYYLASTVEKEKFRLDVKYQSDTTGVYLSYIPEQQVKEQPIIRVLGADRLDNNNKAHSNGYFDYVEGYTISNGRVFIPKVEPFGSYMRDYLVKRGVAADKAEKYAFTELYDSTKTVAKQIAEKNKYQIAGQFKGSAANVISLDAYNVPQGSVVVTAGGITLKEGTDYSVDYSAGEVTILNQSIIDAGTAVNVSLESNTDFGQTRKTMFGLNWEYDFTKNFQLSGTIQHLSEQALTTKVSMGSEPLKNTLWGINLNWRKESQWLTNVLDKIPFLHLTQPSQISFTGEFAQLIAGEAGGTQDNASYIDDFEGTKTTIDVTTPTSWFISSVPSLNFKDDYSDKTGLSSGFHRSLLAWYTIDPLFTRRGSSLTPGHIKGDLKQLSNHYVREVYTKELFPLRDQSSYQGATNTLNILNLAYYPSEPGPYNFNVTDLQADGTLQNPQRNWGGMMRKLDTNDFEQANIEYIEFWMLDPFIYSREQADAADYGGDFYINLGEVSEDILRDGKKFYESGMPVDGSKSYTYTQWGKIPTQSTVTYAFATTSGSRALQDVGFNGLTDAEEQEFYKSAYLDQIQGKVNQAVFDSIFADPARDDYHYFRGSDWDEMRAPILQRYKYINNPQGNSPDSDSRSESYDTSYKSTPDVEDINQDYTLNEYEKYFQYRVSIRPEDLVVGNNHIVDKREYSQTWRDNTKSTVTWYQFRIPIDEFESRQGNINDFSSIRFMRMFLTGFKKPIVLRFGTFDLVMGKWRTYDQPLSAASGGTLDASSVSLEENGEKTPVNYVLPPGIRREQDPSQPQLVEANEQALSLVVKNMSTGEAKAVYKNSTLDLRQYKRIQMFVHANALEQNITRLQDGDLSVFIRLGSDYKNNYYEYEIPLKLTEPRSNYNRYVLADCKAVWPEENMLDVPLSVFTALKKNRNKAKAQGVASYLAPYSMMDAEHPQNKITIVGNPSLGEVKTMMLGVRNNSADIKSGEVWINELRLKEHNNSGGWAANANLNVQLSDLGSVNATGRYISEGFGGLEDGVASRTTDNYGTYSVTTSLEMGKFFPDKAKVSIPLYYSVTKEKTTPKYNPLDTDMELKDALDAAGSKHERDSIENIAATKITQTNFSISNARVGIATKRHPMPYDPANFSFTYSHQHQYTTGETTMYERKDNWRGALDYSWSPVYKAWEPFKGLKNKSKWLDILKRFGLNWLPQNIAFNTEMTRDYYELQERDMETLMSGAAGVDSKLPLTFSEQFLWNREFSINWDLTKNLHMNFQSATHAQIEEPYTPVNKDLYADQYHAWKDSVWTSIRHWGAPLDYSQNFQASYKVPLNLLPVFDWVNSDASYNANYSWERGTEDEEGNSYGNTINTQRELTLNGNFNLVKLYNHVPFLKKVNDKFDRTQSRAQMQRKKQEKKKKKQEAKEQAADPKKALPKNKRAFEREITLLPDTTFKIRHGKNTKRLIVNAKTEDGKVFSLKYKKVDNNQIRIISKVDTAMKVKLSVLAKEPLDDKKWYKGLQLASRLAMMVRNVSINYRSSYQLTLPGFLPSVGDAFGQKKVGQMAPGLDFAFGMVGDDYIGKARNNDWLLCNDSIATPATTSRTDNLTLRATLEPVKDFKIDLSATRTKTTQKSIQYMYEGTPTTQSGAFQMTTISLGSAFEGMGNANSGYRSKTFEKFVNSLAGFRDRVEAQYAGTVYPAGSALAGGKFDASRTPVNQYSSDVMIPAFLKAYTSMGGNSLSVFPALSRMLPNWTIRYSGLGRLPWFNEHFKSININHSYKSVFAVGSYNSYSTFQEYMNGLGFVSDATTGNPSPSSMFNISQVSINESFSPLLGMDVTFNNNMTVKAEYRQTRVLNLSMTSVQLNEALSKDWVIGMGYRINNFDVFGWGAKASRSKSKGSNKNAANKNATTTKTVQNGTNHDLNLRLDFSFRKQAAIVRDIASMVSSASSGNNALKLSFSADYTFSKLLTMSFYYDRQTNTPLLSSSSYPTTTQDFGLSIKFSLTR